MNIEKEYVEGLLRKIERLQAELQKANQMIVELQTAKLRQGGAE